MNILNKLFIKIVLFFNVMGSFSYAADVSNTHYETEQKTRTTISELQNLLDEERSQRGYFIRSLIKDLKQCSNQKLLALNYLPLKASYWWDRKLDSRTWHVTNDVDFHNYKDFLIDRKFRSSVYDREGPSRNIELDVLLSACPYPGTNFINSWESVEIKLNTF